LCALAHGGETKLLRERTPGEGPTLVLAVAHFAYPGHDLADVKFDDVL
jgi:hypothetical protein